MFDAAIPLLPSDSQTASVGAASVIFRVTLLTSGRLAVELDTDDFSSRLSLRAADSRLLVQSDGDAVLNPRLDQHLGSPSESSDYYLEVTGLAGAAGTFTITTHFEEALAPLTPFPAGDRPIAVASADFDRDGNLDLAVVNLIGSTPGLGSLSIFLGLGDGSFSLFRRLDTGGAPAAIVSGDWNGDRFIDLAVANQGTRDVSIFLGDPVHPGTFVDGTVAALGAAPNALTVADLDGDGLLDLLAACSTSDSVVLLRGVGQGKFADSFQVAALGPGANAVRPFGITTGFFNDDALLDIATTNADSHNVSVLLGLGDNTFQHTKIDLASPSRPQKLVNGDFDGDGHLDLAVVNRDTADIRVLLGDGQGDFRLGERYQLGNSPQALVTADLDGDRVPDFAAVNFFSNSVSVVLGNGDGTFQAHEPYDVGGQPGALTAGDFDGDGRFDLAVANSDDTVSILLNEGDGVFPRLSTFQTGISPVAAVTDDLDRDGTPDLVVVNQDSGDLSILLGNRDGTFTTVGQVALANVTAVELADFNSDGRLDIVATSKSSGKPGGILTVLPGNGDGSFPQRTTFDFDLVPTSLATGDFNRDGRLDVALAFWEPVKAKHVPRVRLLLSNNAGGLKLGANVQGKTAAYADVDVLEGLHLVAADFDGDNRLDLALANRPAETIVLLHNIDGKSFERGDVVGVEGDPAAIVAGDFNGDGRPDLATANEYAATVSVLLLGRQGFAPPLVLPAGGRTESLTVADLDGDGLLDLAAANANPDTISVFLNRTGGAFAAALPLKVGDTPKGVVSADFNGDGLADLATVNNFSLGGTVLMGVGAGRFEPPSPASAPRVAPTFGDVDNDGTPDTLLVNRGGELLLRRGRSFEPGRYDPPILVHPSFAARDAVLLRLGSHNVVAALASAGNALILFTGLPGAGFSPHHVTLPEGVRPTRLAAADLDGDGRADLLALNAAARSLSVFLQDAAGELRFRHVVPTAVAPGAEITLADVNADTRPDILLAGAASGDVAVLLNEGAGDFAAALRYRAGLGLSGLGESENSVEVRSGRATAGLTVADVNRDGHPDVIALNRNGTTLLLGRAAGSFLDPRPIAPGVAQGVVRSADLNGDANPDLVILDQSRNELRVLLGNGRGDFQAAGDPTSAGLAPVGLELADVRGRFDDRADGIPDLVVGNDFGDLLIFTGNGDGTVQTTRGVDNRVAFALADLDGDAQPDVLFADEGRDRLSVQLSGGDQERSFRLNNGVLGPRAVASADLNGDGLPDMILANGGGNDVVVYLGLGGGEFGRPQTFFAGVTPSALAVADFDGDSLADLAVTNEGSNDVSILLGRQQGERGWTLVAGPRLQTGLGPNAVVVGDFGKSLKDGTLSAVPDGILDLVVSNGASNSVTLLPGRGDGFFDDRQDALGLLGVNPVDVLLGNFDGLAGLDLVTANAGSNDLTFVSNFALGGVGVRLSSGGVRPLAAAAGDVNGDGLDDLFVANNGDGVIARLDGSADGLVFVERLTFLGLEHPTDLALNAERNALLGGGEGSDALFRLLLTSLGRAGEPGVAPDLGPAAEQFLGGVSVLAGPGFPAGAILSSATDFKTAEDSPTSAAPGRRVSDGSGSGVVERTVREGDKPEETDGKTPQSPSPRTPEDILRHLGAPTERRQRRTSDEEREEKRQPAEEKSAPPTKTKESDRQPEESEWECRAEATRAEGDELGAPVEGDCSWLATVLAAGGVAFFGSTTPRAARRYRRGDEDTWVNVNS